MTNGVVKTALISVSDKTGVVELAQRLDEDGVAILSTGGTSKLLKDNGVSVKDVSDHTGFDEIMDGRVKTLHPTVHGGILGRRGQDDAVMAANGITPIDLVIVNLYPFEQTVAKPDCSLNQAIENIDIGGPAMLRAAAKNFAHVTVVVDQEDYGRVLESIDRNDGAVDEATRFDLAVKTFEYTAHYDGKIASYLGGEISQENKDDGFSRTWNAQYVKKQTMRYGENPHQGAAFYVERSGGAAGTVSSAEQLQGKALSYNNIADTDAALKCVKQFNEGNSCVIVKHANPCGVAVADSQLEAYESAFSTDPESAFGGIIAFNEELDGDTAQAIVDKQFAEVIIAPVVSEAAREVLSAKSNVRLLQCGVWGKDTAAMGFKQVDGGLLVQRADNLLYEDLKVVTEQVPTDDQMADLLFAWKVAKSVKSNAIVYGQNQMTIGVGAGQMSRVNSARIAAIKAEHAGLAVKGAVMASDAFFPFRDGLDNAAEVGIAAVIQPGGSMRDGEVIAAANEHGIAMVLTGIRHFNH